jgi:hypothetical protein
MIPLKPKRKGRGFDLLPGFTSFTAIGRWSVRRVGISQAATHSCTLENHHRCRRLTSAVWVEGTHHRSAAPCGRKTPPMYTRPSRRSWFLRWARVGRRWKVAQRRHVHPSVSACTGEGARDGTGLLLSSHSLAAAEFVLMQCMWEWLEWRRGVSARVTGSWSWMVLFA